MADNEKIYSVYIYDKESRCEQPMRCLAADEDEARKKGEWYIGAWSLAGGKITKIDENKFQIGQLYTTAGVDSRMHEDSGFSSFVYNSVNRFIDLDWGDTCEKDAKSNEEALLDGNRILAVYNYKKTDEKIWIITEAGRSVTTILFPEEY